MTPHHSPDPSEELDQARATISYLLGDIMRLKDELGEATAERNILRTLTKGTTCADEPIVEPTHDTLPPFEPTTKKANSQ